jgi:IS30 family transposase
MGKARTSGKTRNA